MRSPGLLTALHLIAVAAILQPSPGAARDWKMLEDQSRLEFVFRQMGSPVRGKWREFTADIRFDPADLASARVETVIQVDSVDTGNSERDAGIIGADWFDAAAHPTATFTSTGFAHQGGDDYLVTGELTIRGITETIELPMTIAVDGDRATASGTIDLDRRSFEIGRGDWASDAAVGYDVVLQIDVSAEAAN